MKFDYHSKKIIHWFMITLSFTIQYFESLQWYFYRTKKLKTKKNGITEEEISPGKLEETHYIPHHPVIRDDKITTKIDIVFDASARNNGPSLNDGLYKGPHLTPLLYHILLRFCSHVVALTSDLGKAFLQINVNENDLDYLRFLWFDNIF